MATDTVFPLENGCGPRVPSAERRRASGMRQPADIRLCLGTVFDCGSRTPDWGPASQPAIGRPTAPSERENSRNAAADEAVAFVELLRW